MTLYDQIDSNKRRSLFLTFFFVILIIGLGWLFSYVYDSSYILYIAVGFAVFQALIGYFRGDKVALAVSGAKPIEKKDNPRLWNSVENLSIATGLPMPKVYIIDDPAPNAFATGRDPEHASVAVTTGLLEMLSDSELAGVLAHEMSHVKNYDVLLMTIVVVLVGVVAILSDFFIRLRWFGFGRRDDNGGGGGMLALVGILVALIAPITATLIQLSISRKREYLADSSGALITRYPEGLASALEKIGRYGQPMQRASTATAHLYIANPFGRQSAFSKLFSTHPPIEERIALLRQLSK